jgi:hypothetical protein
MNKSHNIHGDPTERAILFITFYGLLDYIEEIVNEFETVQTEEEKHDDKYIYSVHWYPYLKYVNDLNMDTSMMLTHLVQTAKEKKITHIFWLFLPENASFYATLHHNIPGVKFIFYNFDDLKNFNVANLGIANHMDYFIQPTLINQPKYSLILRNNVYYIPHYVHVDLVCLTGINEMAINMCEYESIDNKIDCMIIVENCYQQCDVTERNTLNGYINSIKNTLIDHDYTFKLYGDAELENVYPDIYEDELNVMNEGIRYMNTGCVVILDVADDVSKRFSEKIINASLNKKKIFTNSYGMDIFVRKFDSNADSQIIDMNDINPLIGYIETTKLNNDQIQENRNTMIHDNQKYNIRNWVYNILSLISDNNII